FAMDQQDRLVYLIGVEERRDVRIDLCRLPEISLFVLKTEWRQRAVVGSAASNAGTKDVGVSEQIRRHECSVAVAANANPIAVRHAHFDSFIDRSLCGVNYLLNKC